MPEMTYRHITMMIWSVAYMVKVTEWYTKNRGFIYTVDEDAIKKAEDDLANATQDKVKAELQEQIDLLEQWRDKWAEIPDAFEKAMNA